MSTLEKSNTGDTSSSGETTEKDTKVQSMMISWGWIETLIKMRS